MKNYYVMIHDGDTVIIDTKKDKVMRFHKNIYGQIYNIYLPNVMELTSEMMSQINDSDQICCTDNIIEAYEQMVEFVFSNTNVGAKGKQKDTLLQVANEFIDTLKAVMVA